MLIVVRPLLSMTFIETTFKNFIIMRIVEKLIVFIVLVEKHTQELSTQRHVQIQYFFYGHPSICFFCLLTRITRIKNIKTFDVTVQENSSAIGEAPSSNPSSRIIFCPNHDHENHLYVFIKQKSQEISKI